MINNRTDAWKTDVNLLNLPGFVLLRFMIDWLVKLAPWPISALRLGKAKSNHVFNCTTLYVGHVLTCQLIWLTEEVSLIHANWLQVLSHRLASRQGCIESVFFLVSVFIGKPIRKEEVSCVFKPKRARLLPPRMTSGPVFIAPNGKARPGGGGGGAVGYQYTLFRSPVMPIYLQYKTVNTKYLEIQEKQNTLYP